MGNRVLKTGWANLQRNSYLSFAAVGIMSLALIVVMALMAFQYMTNRVVISLEDKVDISAYFKVDADEEDILEIKSDLEGLTNVLTVDYVSRETALEDFRAAHAGDEIIQESLDQLDGENPLSASLNVQAVDPSQYASIAQFLSAGRFSGIIDKVNYFENEDVIERVRGISSGLRTGGLLTTLVLAVIAVLVTFNTIRLTIYNQKEEIEIMRLVGASNWQIRGPYVTEGGFYGLFAGVLAMALMYPAIYLISERLVRFSPDIRLFDYFVANVYQVVPIILFFGIFLGMFSSLIAIRKHLKI